jgi:hypothetical protein
MAVENLTDLLHNSQKRFGTLLSDVCEVAGLTQGQLSRAAKGERQRLIDAGYIPAESMRESMAQPTISKVMAGVQAPTYMQVYIWLRVIRTHYESTRFAEQCRRADVAVPTLSPEMERILWRLATFISPDDLARVCEQSKDINPLEGRVSLIEHKEMRWKASR